MSGERVNPIGHPASPGTPRRGSPPRRREDAPPGESWRVGTGIDVTESDDIGKVARTLLRCATGGHRDRRRARPGRRGPGRRTDRRGTAGGDQRGRRQRGTGAEFQKRLYRIGLPAWASSDGHAALTGAALLGPRDVVVAVSHGGRTRETAHPAVEAASRGALTVAVTNDPDSPLARRADIALVASVRVEGRTETVLARHAQPAVVDLWYIAVAQRTFDRTPRAMAATTEAVSRYRHAPGTGNTPRTGKVSGTGAGTGTRTGD